MRAARPLAVLAIMSTQIMRGDWCSMYTYLPSGKEGEEPRSPRPLPSPSSLNTHGSPLVDGGTERATDADDGVPEGCELPPARATMSPRT